MAIDCSVESLAEDALLLRFGEGIDPAVNLRVHAAARVLRRAPLPGLIDISPAYASLLLCFDPLAWTTDAQWTDGHARIAAAIRERLKNADAPDDDGGCKGHPIEVPVSYGGRDGPDLESVAEHAGMTVGEVIALHTAGEYVVAMLGFAPGFVYLLGLDPRLQMPRRAIPRTRVPPGSVAIGGAQTGIYPRALPGGWHLIGHTPLALFDPSRDPPALLGPGDRVRFCVLEDTPATAHPA